MKMSSLACSPSRLTNVRPFTSACFVPGDHTYFKLRTTYDVFDRQGNKIREGCQAESTIDLRDHFGSYLSTTRGHCYTLNVKVQPTYLYVLSEPDLDNPTLTIDN